MTADHLPSIRSRLFWLVGICVLPAGLMAAGLAVHNYQRGQAEIARNTINVARGAMASVDTALLNISSTLSALGTSPSIASRHFGDFYGQARETVKYQQLTNIVLIDADGQQQVNTLKEFGMPLPAKMLPQSVMNMFVNGVPVVTDLFQGPVTGKPTVGVGVPVSRDGKIIYGLNAGVSLHRLADILQNQHLPSGWVATILDSSGTVIARSRDNDQFVGQKAMPELIARVAQVNEGHIAMNSLDGVPVSAAFHRSAVSKWTMVVGVPTAILNGALTHTLWLILAGALLLLSMSLALAAVISGRIANSIKQLVAPALALGSGNPVTVPLLHVREAQEVGVALLRAADLLHQAQTLSALADAALHDNEMKLKLFIEGVPAGVAMFDREMRYVAVSKRFIEQHQIIAPDIIGRCLYDLFPTIEERWREIHRRCLAGETMRCEDDFYHRADGSIAWIRWEIKPWSNSTNGGIILFSEDITARKITEAALRDSETAERQSGERYMAILNALPAQVALLDRDGLIVAVNERWKNFASAGKMHASDSWTSWNYLDVCDGATCDFSEQGHEVANALRQILAGTRSDFEIEYPCHSPNEKHWFRMVATPVVEQSRGGAVVMHIDITERKIAEGALRGAEQRLAGVIDSAMDAIVSIEIDQRIVLFNAAAEAMFGYRAADIIGQSLNRLIPQRFVAQHRGHIETFGTTGVSARAMGALTPVSAVRANGEEFPVEASISKVIVEGQNLFTVILRDVTERKVAQLAIEATHRELARSNAELEQFAYAASHDLQEPLRSVCSCMQLLKKRYGGSLDARADEFIEHAISGSQRMQALIDDLLAYSRVSSTPRPFLPVDSLHAVEIARANLMGAIAASAAQITCDALPVVAGDASQLAQLFQNLIGNAIKFRGANPALVHIGARRGGDDWVFSVADQGIGIESQYFTRIFQIFQRLHTRDEYAGTGIGLTICNKIVERHGGRIWVESHYGEGSTFYFTLPASEPLVTAKP